MNEDIACKTDDLTIASDGASPLAEALCFAGCGHTAGEVAETAVCALTLGAECVEDVERLREDPAVAQQPGGTPHLATVDLDATIVESDKRAAFRAYTGKRGYQPVVAVWGGRRAWRWPRSAGTATFRRGRIRWTAPGSHSRHCRRRSANSVFGATAPATTRNCLPGSMTRIVRTARRARFATR